MTSCHDCVVLMALGVLEIYSGAKASTEHCRPDKFHYQSLDDDEHPILTNPPKMAAKSLQSFTKSLNTLRQTILTPKDPLIVRGNPLMSWSRVNILAAMSSTATLEVHGYGDKFANRFKPQH